MPRSSSLLSLSLSPSLDLSNSTPLSSLLHSIVSHSIPSFLWRPTSSAARLSACGDCVTVAPLLHASRHAMCVCLPIAGAQLHAQVQRACDDETCRDAITSAVVAFLGTRKRRSILTSCHSHRASESVCRLLHIAYCMLPWHCCHTPHLASCEVLFCTLHVVLPCRVALPEDEAQLGTV